MTGSVGVWVYIAQGLARSSKTVGSSIPRANSLINWQCTLGNRKIKLSKAHKRRRLKVKKKKENAPLAAVPDVNGCVGQDFAVAVPAAVGGGAPASRVVSTDLAENLVFAVLPQVQLQVRVTLAVARREAETPHSVDLDEVQVKLKRSRRREEL